MNLAKQSICTESDMARSDLTACQVGVCCGTRLPELASDLSTARIHRKAQMLLLSYKLILYRYLRTIAKLSVRYGHKWYIFCTEVRLRQIP